MNYEFFGVVIERRGIHNGAGILVLARFEAGVRQPSFNPSEFVGPTETVFLTGHSTGFEPGTPVWFAADENEKLRAGLPEDRKDSHKVASRGGKPAIEAATSCCALISMQLVRDIEAREPALVRNMPALPPNVYVDFGMYLRGPWNVEGIALAPLRGSHYNDTWVYDFSGRPWKSDVLVEIPARHLSRVDAPATRFLLERLDPSLGQAVDLATGPQLATWLLKKLGGTSTKAAEALRGLDQSLPRWREALKQALDESSDATDRQTSQARFLHLERSLSLIDWTAESLRDLSHLPAFEAIWTRALETRQEQLEAEAIKRSKSLEDNLRARHERLIVEVEALETERSGLARQQAETEANLRALTDHLLTEQDRLRRDLSVILPLLSQQPDFKAAPQTPHQLEMLLAARRQVPQNDLKGELVRWNCSCSSVLVEAAYRCCRLVLVPDPRTPRAWAAASGASLFLLQVEPHWLCFNDAWQSGLEAVFWEAVAAKGSIVLHLLDLDRSPPELWLRPILDLASGLREQLGDRIHGWPASLSISASLSAGPPRAPLSQWLVDHFGAVDEQSTLADDLKTPVSDRMSDVEHYIHSEQELLFNFLLDRAPATDSDEEEHRQLQQRKAEDLRRFFPQTFRLVIGDG